MKKAITLRIEESVIKNAQVMAILDQTKISHVVEAFLKDYAKDVDISKVDRRTRSR